MWRSSLLLVIVTACATVDDPPVPEPPAALDETVFKCSVEPVLVRQCSYSACHGLAGSPFRIYSQGKLRLAASADIDATNAPLTAAEHHANFLAAAGLRFGTADARDNLLLRKPLPASAGGYAHEGGAVFGGTGDPEWMKIYAWLSGSGRCP